jgi:nicotinate-nucleotide adenylyltransferase
VSRSGAKPEVVGLLGGSFDPVHEGHLRIAAEVRRLTGLSRVLLMPAAWPPHKLHAKPSPAHHREAMLRLAIRGREGLEISTIELETGRVCYTIDTLRRLLDGEPPCKAVFILGMDSLRQITTWWRWRELIDEFDLAVIERTEDDPRMDRELHPEVVARLVPLAVPSSPDGSLTLPHVGRGGRIFRLPVPPIPISSSAIRARARAGDDLGGLVPPSVARYIHRTGLYRQENEH